MISPIIVVVPPITVVTWTSASMLDSRPTMRYGDNVQDSLLDTAAMEAAPARPA